MASILTAEGVTVDRWWSAYDFASKLRWIISVAFAAVHQDRT